MNAFFVAFDTSLSRSQLTPSRRKLARLLKGRDIELQALHVGNDPRSVLIRLVMDAKATPVVAVDDAHPLPNDASWLADLTANVIDLPQLRRPQVVYVTRRASASGQTQALRHGVVRNYIKRDERGAWVDEAVEAVLNLREQLRAAATPIRFSGLHSQ